MKRFISSLATVILILGLNGLALDAQASPRAFVSGDQPASWGSLPSGGDDRFGAEGGSDGSAGGVDGAGSDGTSGAGDGAGSDGGAGTGAGDPGATVPGLSTPRVMLSGFVSTPAEVEAGQDFTVSFTLRNTSKRTRVENIKVSLSSGEGAAFLPADGSSSIFIDRISADDNSIQTMTFHSLPSLEERPYQMQLSVEYEDAVANAYSSQESVSVSVKQKVRADTSVPQVVPEMLEVGQDGSVSFSIHNQGRTKLYNAKATVKDGQAVSGEEIFIGTIEPGTSGAVDMIVRAEEESENPLVMEVTYEDVEGTVTSLSKEVPLSVMPMMEQFPEDDFMNEEGDMGMGFALWPLIIVGLVLLMIVALVVFLVRRARRRSREREDMESLSMLGDEPLVPNDTMRG
ncbi:MAG: hypothetical protein ACTHU1_09320 [Arachnia sp.]